MKIKKPHNRICRNRRVMWRKIDISFQKGYIQKNPHRFWMSCKTVVFYWKTKGLSIEFKKFIKFSEKGRQMKRKQI